ncbi:hypothetical protein J2T58_000627 [Methanocalculus alkaliphilus]|uniref:hypothetical protein n=1 Tax=Methanocalculus alkaliphilus TaxID=768730 RepID=UPI00209D48F1|nr:hypothetical protein [Methanocalculus alkaliphilus]MCP1714782.1 hypothetical protein [Methanocalculus alkaliphilus]
MKRVILCILLSALFCISAGAALEIDTLASEYSEGEFISISGTTNLAPDHELHITVVSQSFYPTVKDTAAGFTGTSGVISVVEGDEVNTWSFLVDTTGFIPNEYTILVESIEADVRASSSFTLREAEPIPEPTPEEPPEPSPTPTPTPTRSPEPPEATGSAIISLMGVLCAVATLILRGKD